MRQTEAAATSARARPARLNDTYDAFGTKIAGVASIAKGDYGLAKLGYEQAWKDL
jgi:hypothetical protein